MKIQIFSDLHLDSSGSTNWEPQNPTPDAYVVAGDLFDDGLQSVQWCKQLADKRRVPVIFVPGNHEFCGGSVADRIREMQRAAAGSRVAVLSNRAIRINGVTFAGTTLWTDFEAAGVAFEATAKMAACDFIEDFSTVFYGDSYGNRHLLTPGYTVRMHQRGRRFLESQLEKAYQEPVVVITHHAPSLASVHSRYERSVLNPAFASNMDMLVGYSNAVLWVHGHMHTSSDYALGATRVVCNPKGVGHCPNEEFNGELVVEL